MMLTKLKEVAEAYLKTKVVDCVISVCYLGFSLSHLLVILLFKNTSFINP